MQAIHNTFALTHSNIGKKALVGMTGAVLFGFVVFHLIGNLQVFLGREHLNEYSEFLHSYPKVLWIARLVLLASAILHITLTVQLAIQNRVARGVGYRIARDVGEQGPLMRYARSTMILSGPIVLAFIVFHLMHLTLGANVVPGHAFDPTDVYANVIHGFQNPWITGFYVFANVFLGLHLYQGGHSMLQSLGLRAPRFDHQVRGAAIGFAAFVSLGNVLMPLAILGGLIGREVA